MRLFDRRSAPKRCDTWFLYGLVDSRKPDLIRYIGITNNPRARLGLHVSQAGKEGWRKSRWVGAVIASGGDVLMTILHQGLDQSEAKSIEIETIAQHRSMGGRLTNLTDGGDGVTGATQSEATRQKKRIALLGLRRSEAVRQNMSESKKGVRLSPQHRQALREAHLARYRDNPGLVEIQRQNTVQRFHDPAQRQAASTSTKARFADPEARAHHSKVMRQTYASDPTLSARREAAKRKNGPQINSALGLKGVIYEARRSRFRASIQINGRPKHLGYFATSEDAARAYDLAAFAAWGDDCYLNCRNASSSQDDPMNMET